MVGGTANGGTIFKMTPSGQVSTIHAFCLESGCPDGEYPWGSLVQDYKGNIYGTASAGGANGSYGTVFQVSPNGNFKTLYSFCAVSGCSDGIFPLESLVLAPGGTLYGATQAGGAYGSGTVFKITAGGVLTTLHDFCALSKCTDGSIPTVVLLATDGNIYGATREGGATNIGSLFKLSTTGQFETIYSFCTQPACADGGGPFSLMQATDGNFYGTTQQAGGPNSGTIFEITPSGAYTVLHTFCSSGSCTDGKLPSTTGLLQHTNGTLYGVIGHGGNVTSNGTIFSVANGMAPFVTTTPGAGVVGGAVQILGTNLSGATSVTFNGTAAKFKVVSGTEITATVPSGATSGLVRVAAPSGKLTSNVAFAVVQ